MSNTNNSNGFPAFANFGQTNSNQTDKKDDFNPSFGFSNPWGGDQKQEESTSQPSW